MTRFIAVVSGKGGVGKTTTALNLGTALIDYGHDVILLDGNLTSPNVGLYLGVNNPPTALHDILSGRSSIQQALYVHASGLRILPGSVQIAALKKLDLNQLKKVFHSLQGAAETILIDTGAGLTKEVLSVLQFADEVLVVTNPELVAVTEALRIIKKSEEQNIVVLGVVLNKVHESDELSLSNVESILDRPIISIIPESDSIKQAQAMRHPVVYADPNSIAADIFKQLAERLK